MILISAGHSNTDPGAAAAGWTEAEVVRDMRNMVGHYLSQAHVSFMQDGEGNTNLPLKDAGRLAALASIAVEFHCNSFSKPTAQGVEALAQSKDKVLSQKLCKAVSKHMNNTIRGADGGWKNEGSGQHSRLFFVQKGGIILELFFISNPVERNRWTEVKWLVAKEVAGVLIEAAGGKLPQQDKIDVCSCCGQTIKELK